MNVTRDDVNIRLTWKSEDPEDVEAARSFFLKLTNQGWLAARLTTGFRRILTFKPELEEIWFIPVSEGG